MNPFVNPNKRGIVLPNGCKDLMDVLRRGESTKDNSLQVFIRLLLFQAQQDGATDFVIGSNPTKEETTVSYKVGDIWCDMSPLSSHIRPHLVAELAQMAKLRPGKFPMKGVVNVTLGQAQSTWTMVMKSVNDECTLVRVND